MQKQFDGIKIFAQKIFEKLPVMILEKNHNWLKCFARASKNLSTRILPQKAVKLIGKTKFSLGCILKGLKTISEKTYAEKAK